MTVFDFNLLVNFGQITLMATSKGQANVYRANSFLTTDGLSSKVRIQQMRRTLSGQLQSTKFLMSRSVPLYGIRTTDLQRQSSRYRNLSPGYAAQTLSCRHSGQCRSKHNGRRRNKMQAIMMKKRIRLVPRTESAPSWHWDLKLTG